MPMLSPLYPENYDLKLVEMTNDHIPGLQNLTVCMGWPHRHEDLSRMLGVGRGIAAVDELGRVHGTAMHFSHGGDLSSLAMVVTYPGEGHDGIMQWLTNGILEKIQTHSTFLNAVNEETSLYHRMGADLGRVVHQHQGYLLKLPSFRRRARPADLSDLREICALDANAYGADRSRHLIDLASISETRVVEKNGRLQGFAMRRRFGRGFLIGPVIASNDSDAIALTGSLMSGLTGHYIRLDTRTPDGSFRQFLSSAGLPAEHAVTTMSLGQLPPTGPEKAYGLCSHSTG